MRRFLLFLLMMCLGSISYADEDAKEIVRRADQHLRGDTNQSEMTMTIVRPDWSREVSLKSWTKGTEYSLILVTAPARDKGTTFLKRDNEIWNWVPAIERIVKIPPSMMMQSWMGSDFTNDDLIKESSLVKDYTHAIVGDTLIAERECYKIEMIPHEDAPVVWGKINLWVSKEDDLQLRAEYYDEDFYLVNTMIMSDIKEMGGRLIPTHLAMFPADKPGHSTILQYQSIEFNAPITDDYFSQQMMKRVR